MIEGFKSQGLDMSYAEYRLGFLTTRVNDRNYPLDEKTAIEMEQCAITNNIHLEQQKHPEIKVVIPENFCNIKPKK